MVVALFDVRDQCGQQRLAQSGGSDSVTIPAGGEAVSDPAAVTVAQQETAVVSITMSGTDANVPAHGVIQGPAYYTAGDGVDHAADPAATAFTHQMQFQPFLTGIDVTSQYNTTGSLVLYGDQTVNGDTSTSDGVSHLSDDFADALQNDQGNAGVVPYGILNLGQDSGAASNNLLPAATASPAPLSAIDPVDRDILDHANVRTVLISTGTSDILANESVATIEARLTDLASQVRVYTSDTYGSNPYGFITVYVATIPPATPSAPFTAAQETVRETVNNYILCGISAPTVGVCTDEGTGDGGGNGGSALGGDADGAIDFASAVSTDGTDTGSSIQPSMLWQDSNGKSWPGDTYYNALAQQYLTDTDSGNVGVQPMMARVPLLF